MTVKPKGRSSISRGHQFKLNPTTRAIRNVLALGLAMATTTPVLAGTCDASDPTNAVCDGSFVDTNISFAIDDLTIVVGGASATDIQPLDGMVGIDLYSANGSISLTSAADIVTLNAAAISVRAPNGDVHVENRGNLQTSYADGIEAISYDGNISVVNAGSVSVFGPRGIEARSGSGDVSVDNAAGASIVVANAYGNATGIDASNYYGDVSVLNEGVVDASVVSYGNATGIRAASFTGDISVTNSATGLVSATTDNIYGGTAIAIRANTSLGGSVVNNAGDINAGATAEYGDATSYGVLNRGGYYGATSTINTGTITATASTGDGVGWAWGIRDRGRTNADVDNSGDINVEADAGTGYATASGAYVRGMYAHNENSGSITADASVAGIGTARAYGTMTFGYYASMDNSGDITATTHVGDGVSVAIGAISYYNIDFSASNTGTITADAYATVGTASAMAIRNGADELATIYNGVDGSLVAHAVSGDGAAFAYGAFANSNTSSLANYGSISADATTYLGNVYGGAIARATGASIQAEEAYDASVVNGQYGDISAKASVHSDGSAYSFGVIAYGQASGRVENHGDISAESYADSGLAVAIGSVAAGGFGVTLNYGSISADATVANDGLARAVGAYTQGQVATLVNEGVITANGDIATGYVAALGAQLYGAWNAAYNYGDITASASALAGEATAYGIYSFGVYGSNLFNADSGNLVVSADVVDGVAVALGGYNVAYVYGAYVTNDGSISATASVSGSDSASIAGAIGAQNIALLYGDAVVVNNGDISATASGGAGYALAKGTYNLAYLFNASVTNAGSISASAFNAYGYATAFGVQNASVYYGNASTANSGTISAVADVDVGFADATGVDTVGSYDGTVTNDGSIFASATADTGYTRAIGVTTYVGGAAVTQNFGDISAIATGHGEYGYAVAAGASTVVAFAVNNTASMDNHGVISATATADGRRGFAGATGTSTVAKYAGSLNYGSINVVASAGYTGVAKGFGIETAGMLDASTINHGIVSVQAITDQGYSVVRGVTDYAYSQRNADATTVNYGDIHVSAYTAGHAETGYGGFAYAFGVDTKANHYATVHNAGSITALADAEFGVARAKAVELDSRRDGSTLTNDGVIYARADAYTYHAVAVGSDVEARGRILGATTLNNAGARIIAIATADNGGYAGATGSGTSVWGVDGQAALMINHGDIIALASASGGDAFAKGQHTLGNLVSNNFNYGNILADAQAADGLAVAEGNKTWAWYGDAALVNAASITARADAGVGGEAFAYGSMLVGPTSGSTDNAVDGTISAVAIGGGDGLALAIGSITAGGSASVVNHGDIAAAAVSSGYGEATATGVATTGDYAAYQWAFQYFSGTVYNVEGSVTNDGDISATAISELGIAAATGVNAVSQYGTVMVANTGTITAGADGASGSTATGLSLNASGSNSLSNGGDISVTALADAGIANATGVDAISQLADLSFANAGRIAAVANGSTGSTATAASLYAVSINPLTNDGEITATAWSDAGIATAIGLDAVSQYGDVSLVNAGSITAQADGAAGGMAAALSMDFVGNGTFSNGGSISATALGGSGSAAASGVTASSQSGDVSFTNAGTIAAAANGSTGSTATALSLSAVSLNPLGNDGDIIATALSDGGIATAMGLDVVSQYGDVSLVNAGSITAQADGATGAAAAALSIEAVGNRSFSNSGSIHATALGGTGSAAASGVTLASQDGNVGFTNAGAIAVGAEGAAGSTATAVSLDAMNIDPLDNHGDIAATALSDGGIATAIGLDAVSQYGDLSLVNAGSISAQADGAAGGMAAALSMDFVGNGLFSNGGSIHATALGGTGSATASGAAVVAQDGNVDFSNAGNIAATASGGTGSAATALSLHAVSLNPLVNDGDITATALSDGGIATAMGLDAVSQYGDVALVNGGSLAAAANGNAGGMATALSMMFADNSSIINDGSIDATAWSDAGIANAYGVHAVSQNGDVVFANAGTIAAGADGATGSTAAALSMAFAGNGTLSNDGSIAATALGGTGSAGASGVTAISAHGDVTLANTGSITAVANGAVGSTAIAVSLSSAGSNTLTNTGSIVAAGTDATRIAVSSSADAAATIDNAGLISGAILTGNLDDTFTNGVGAIWDGVGHSDFGEGDNAIFNAGTINLLDATIDMGNALGNQFANTGLITVSGDNAIEGLGLFDNHGIIDFQDGAADDTLTIAGDFGGDGQLLVDVSGLHDHGDVLYIGGSVADGSHTIDVNLIDVPTAASSAVTVVSVAGDSTAASFALGDVRYNTANFLALDFDTRLVATIDTANAAPDTFALGMVVTGLNDTGTLAASVAPGAQSLMASQVGTWRQRMGVIDKISKHGLGLWARMFQNEGSVEPSRSASNFGEDGNFAFDQENSGTEIGVDFAVSDGVSLGLLLAKADARQALNGDGVGSTRLDGDTVGAYGTWLSPLGFYVDASYRQMSFDARFSSAAGEIRGGGDADTLNLEAGYAWTLQGGLKIEPQVQYTWTQVDNMDTMTGALARFQAQGGDASTGRLGVMVRKSFGAGTVWTPYASINAVREFDGENAYSINDDFFGTTSTEGTSTLFESGVSVQVGKLSVFGGFNWQDGGAVQGFGGGQLGVRYTW